MQAQSYYRTDQQCRAVLEMQKQHMRDLTKESDQGKIELLEGTKALVLMQKSKQLEVKQHD